MKIGIMGGVFDPIHFGHLQAAEAAREEIGLSLVIFIPAGIPPHKSSPIASIEDRVKMVRSAIRENPAFEISTVETEMRRCSYTIETVRKIKKGLGEDKDYWFIIGSDTVPELKDWKGIEALLSEITFVAVMRHGFPTDGADPRIQRITTPTLPISSTEIREKIKVGKSIRYLVPEVVRRYIYERGLYKM
jgi:nicotinate-nucleotide adenylyltransferase